MTQHYNYSSVPVRTEPIVSMLKEPGFVIFQVEGINIKLPVDTCINGIHDRSKQFITDLFNIDGVEEVFRKYGVVLERAKVPATSV